VDVFKTRRQLIDQALDNLGVLAAGQTPGDEDVSKIDALIDPMVSDLAARDIAYVADPGQLGPANGEIEPALFLWLAHILAYLATPPFGLQGDPSFYVLAQRAEDMLRTIARPARTRRTLRTDPILNRGGRRHGHFR
jgi:hypothetical protein